MTTPFPPVKSGFQLVTSPFASRKLCVLDRKTVWCCSQTLVDRISEKHSRSVQPPESGRVVAVPQVGGLHHRYERRAAQTAQGFRVEPPQQTPLLQIR